MGSWAGFSAWTLAEVAALQSANKTCILALFRVVLFDVQALFWCDSFPVQYKAETVDYQDNLSTLSIGSSKSPELLHVVEP